MNGNRLQIVIDTKVASLMTLDYIEQRAQRGSRSKFEQVLAKIDTAGLEPFAEDQLPDGIKLKLPEQSATD